MEVGFIGLGTMGASMAANLQKAGYELVVHDIRRAAAERHLAFCKLAAMLAPIVPSPIKPTFICVLPYCPSLAALHAAPTIRQAARRFWGLVAASALPLPACGERVGVRGYFNGNASGPSRTLTASRRRPWRSAPRSSPPASRRRKRDA